MRVGRYSEATWRPAPTRPAAFLTARSWIILCVRTCRGVSSSAVAESGHSRARDQNAGFDPVQACAMAVSTFEPTMSKYRLPPGNIYAAASQQDRAGTLSRARRASGSRTPPHRAPAATADRSPARPRRSTARGSTQTPIPPPRPAARARAAAPTVRRRGSGSHPDGSPLPPVHTFTVATIPHDLPRYHAGRVADAAKDRKPPT
jgi:hypothetical protein